MRSILVFLFLLVSSFLLFSCFPCMASCRISGTLVAKNEETLTLIIQMKDGTKMRVRMQQNAEYTKMNRRNTLSGFAIGERVVVNISGPINDDPAQANALMDMFSAGQSTGPGALYPETVRIGGFATIAGPAATGGQNPNVLASIGYGPGFSTPYANVPFTAAPSPSGSPLIGPAVSNMTPAGPSGAVTGGMLPPLTPGPTPIGDPGTAVPAVSAPPANPQSQGSTMPAQAQQMMGLPGTPPPQHLMGTFGTDAGGVQSLQSDPASLIGGQSPASAPAGLLEDHSGSQQSTPGDLIAGGGDQEHEENNFSSPGVPSGAIKAKEIQGRVMHVDLAHKMIFLQVLGAQELASAAIGLQTRIVDARTRQIVALEVLRPGSIVVVTGIKTGECSVQAQLVVIRQ